MTQIDPTTPEGAAYWQQRHAYETTAMDLSGLERPVLEQYARNLQAEVDALKGVLTDIEGSLDRVVHDLALARMVRLDTSAPGADE